MINIPAKAKRREKLIESRKKVGTQEDVAKLLGISRSHLSSIEVGARDPSMKLMLRLVEVLGLTERELFSKLNDK